jgi:hypothetical protein
MLCIPSLTKGDLDRRASDHGARLEPAKEVGLRRLFERMSDTIEPWPRIPYEHKRQGVDTGPKSCD